MSRIYEYQESTYYEGDSVASMDEYLDRINRMHTRMDNFSEAPRSTHPPHHNRVKIFSPEVVHKKVHFTEHVEADRHAKHEEKTIDMEADGFIQKRHKNFESCNTFKGY